MSTELTDEIEQTASEWLVRRQSGAWTQTDQAYLEQWLDASTLHRVAFLRLELAWEESARLKALGAGIPGDLPPPPGRWNLTDFFDADRAVAGSTEVSETTTRKRRPWIAALAASLVVAIGIGGYVSWSQRADRYSTPVGGLASVPMMDGSKITLNTDSEVRVALTEAERRVDLNQGEAFFEVAKDPNRPFVVAAGSKRVVAVGTKFSVCRDGDTIEVVVTEGKVRVEGAGAPLLAQASEPATPSPDGPIFLTPGAIARADDSGVLVQRKTLPEAETRLSWRSGVLTFRDQSLAEAVGEFNRYNVRKIVLADPAVGELKVEGNFRADNVEAFVRLIESGFRVRASAEQDRIVLYSR